MAWTAKNEYIVCKLYLYKAMMSCHFVNPIEDGVSVM